MAGYVSPDGDYWTHAGTTSYDGTHFYEEVQFTDPFGNTSKVCYDAERLFVIEEHTSANAAFDNVTKATIDYRVLQPSLITDPNGNQTAAAFNELGMPVALAVMGQPGAGQGDTLADPTTKIEYDLLAWEASSSPAYIHVCARQQHGAANPGWFETVSYWTARATRFSRKPKPSLIPAVMRAGSEQAGRFSTIREIQSRSTSRISPVIQAMTTRILWSPPVTQTSSAMTRSRASFGWTIPTARSKRQSSMPGRNQSRMPMTTF